jgi:hypothetical protein
MRRVLDMHPPQRTPEITGFRSNINLLRSVSEDARYVFDWGPPTLFYDCLLLADQTRRWPLDAEKMMWFTWPTQSISHLTSAGWPERGRATPENAADPSPS